jgi:Lrp/AsnC family transcriptional regulator, regulator for asnA, asnC and gidA
VRRDVQNLDEIDRAIIEQLQQDGRLPYTKLGAAVGLSEAAARQRVQRLVDSGVVQVVAVTDPLSLGRRRMAMIGIRCEGDTAVAAARIGDLEDVEYVVITAGSYDILAEVVVSDDERFFELLNRIRRVKGVRSTESFVYLRIAKQTYTWGAH